MDTRIRRHLMRYIENENLDFIDGDNASHNKFSIICAICATIILEKKEG